MAATAPEPAAAAPEMESAPALAPEPAPEPAAAVPEMEPAPPLAPEPASQPEAAEPDHDPVIAVEAPGALLFAQAEVISFGQALQVPLASGAAPNAADDAPVAPNAVPDDSRDAAPEVGSK